MKSAFALAARFGLTEENGDEPSLKSNPTLLSLPRFYQLNGYVDDPNVESPVEQALGLQGMSDGKKLVSL